MPSIKTVFFFILKSSPSMKPNFLYSVVELLLGKCSHISNLICNIKNQNSKNKNCFKKYLKNISCTPCIFIILNLMDNVFTSRRQDGIHIIIHVLWDIIKPASFFNKIYDKTLDRIHIYMYICRSVFRLFQIEFKMLLTFVWFHQLIKNKKIKSIKPK